MLCFGKASVSCACSCCIVEEMSRPQKVTLIWFHVCSVLFLVMRQSSVICCGGSNSDLVKVLDKSPGRKACVQYPSALTPVQFERLLHKPSFSVMGRIDMGSMLCALLLRLNGLLDERWVQSTQYFRMVRIGPNFSWLPY